MPKESNKDSNKSEKNPKKSGGTVEGNDIPCPNCDELKPVGETCPFCGTPDRSK